MQRYDLFQYVVSLKGNFFSTFFNLFNTRSNNMLIYRELKFLVFLCFFCVCLKNLALRVICAIFAT